MSIDLNIEIRLDDPRILNWLKNGGKGDLALEKDASYTEKLDLEYYPSSEKQYSTTTKHVQSWTLNIRYYALVREDPKPPHYRQRLSEVEISVPMRHS
ncbi:hypothetical protein JCM19236_6327 [Vibrio sp. JCM 19236]|nr:hypothetical protein JCM19236_6327 [Vibrio sp. JCM 19236]